MKKDSEHTCLGADMRVTATNTESARSVDLKKYGNRLIEISFRLRLGRLQKETVVDNRFVVTLADLRKEGACYDGYNKVVRMLQGKPFADVDEDRDSYIRFSHKEPIALTSILESNNLDDALWALRCVKGADRDIRLFGVWCARQVEHLNTDPAVKACNDVAERYANGEATEEERSAAESAARSAAESAARSAARSAAESAAESAARSAAWSAAESAAESAAWSAAESAARSAAWSAAESAARSAARSAQKDMLILMCNGEAPWQKGKS
jgi:hypothetical protein